MKCREEKGAHCMAQLCPAVPRLVVLHTEFFSTSRKALTRAELGDTLVTKSRHKCDPWGVNPFFEFVLLAIQFPYTTV
jgi:hypothetical protein